MKGKIQYSELTHHFYFVPVKKGPKVDVTDDIQAIVSGHDNEISEYRNALLNCLTQFEFYVDVCEFQGSGKAAIEHIQQLLSKYA